MTKHVNFTQKDHAAALPQPAIVESIGRRRTCLIGFVACVALHSLVVRYAHAQDCDGAWGIHPTIDRVEVVDCDQGTIIGFFGYYSSRTEPEGFMLTEEYNQFCPGSSYQLGQPVILYPGRHREVFSVMVSASAIPQLYWHLGDGLAVLEMDFDGDGVLICADNCPDTANADQSDADRDGIGDACDGCPNDGMKASPGVCGCGVSEADTDGDGVPACFDGCPDDPAKQSPGACGCGIADADSDGDGVADCRDRCPSDGAKLEPGFCGCGVPDVDTNGNNVPDCLEAVGPVPSGQSCRSRNMADPFCSAAATGSVVLSMGALMLGSSTRSRRRGRLR